MAYLENLAAIEKIRNFSFPFIIAEATKNNDVKEIILVVGSNFEKDISQFKSYRIINQFDFIGRPEWGYELYDIIRYEAINYQLGAKGGIPSYPMHLKNEVEHIILEHVRQFNINYLKLNKWHSLN